MLSLRPQDRQVRLEVFAETNPSAYARTADARTADARAADTHTTYAHPHAGTDSSSVRV